jgi:hypothetical protein
VNLRDYLLTPAKETLIELLTQQTVADVGYVGSRNQMDATMESSCVRHARAYSERSNG